MASKLRVIAAVLSLTLIYPACLYYGSWGAFSSRLIAETIYFIIATRALHADSVLNHGSEAMLARKVIWCSAPQA